LTRGPGGPVQIVALGRDGTRARSRATAGRNGGLPSTREP
jgi:hypothetical protein